MNDFSVRVFLVAIIVVAAVTNGSADDKSDSASELAQYYGFTGVELYKLDQRCFNLTAGDFDSDGRTDLLTVDNRASCLRFFRQQTRQDAKEKRAGRDVNEIFSDWRFDVRQIPVDKQIAGLVAADLNGDGRTDVAYVGAPDRLVIRYQPDVGRTEWNDKWTVRLPELSPTAWMISACDLNHDGRMDVAVLGNKSTYLIYQNEAGKMQSPEQLINTSSQLSLLQAADINGDGRDDLSYQANQGSTRGLCARLQTTDGRLGPEICFDLDQTRAVTLSNVDGVPGHEILTIDGRSGRAVVSSVRNETQDSGDLPARLVRFGVGEASGSKGRAIAIGDIDGDQKMDVVVTDPETAQVLVYRQSGSQGLDRVDTFPGLLDATDVCLADVDGDGINEVIHMSPKESAVAVSRFQDGRLTFPQTVIRPAEGQELQAIATLRHNDRPELVVCVKQGAGSRATVELQRFHMSDKSTWERAHESVHLEPDAVGSRGVDLMAMNEDSDQHSSLLVVPAGSGNKGVVLVRFARQDNMVQTAAPLNLGHSLPGELFVDQDSLFVAREAFARRMTFSGDEWSVADQFNAGEAKARIAGVAVLNLDDEDDREVLLVDIGIRRLRALKQDQGIYRPWKETELGTFGFVSTHVADLNNDGREDALLFGTEQFAVLYSGGTGVQLKEISTWEPERDDAYLADIIAGDVNGDGHMDLSVIDTSIDGIQILSMDQQSALKAATHFRVFEEKRLVTESESRGTEPREGIVADVTGDGRKDLILLCHDRLLVYPQDAGTDSDAAEKP
ncbi:MAG: VCBS repeat-containing protein [Planctomycetaceae bacterium]